MPKNFYAQLSKMLYDKPQLLELGGFEGVYDEIYKYEEELLLANGTFASTDEMSKFLSVDSFRIDGTWSDTTVPPSSEEMERLNADPRMEIIREIHRMINLVCDESIDVYRFDTELEKHDAILSKYIDIIPGQREFRFLQSEEKTKEILRELFKEKEGESDVDVQLRGELAKLGINPDTPKAEGNVIPFDSKKPI